MIRLELSQESVRNGERVTGHATWSSSGGKEPRRFQVICRWRIEGKAKKQEVIDTAVGGNQIPFDFEVPGHGPLSYDGKLFRIIWEIVASADIPWARDEEEVKTFLVRARPWNADDWKDEEEEDTEDDEPAEAGPHTDA